MCSSKGDSKRTAWNLFQVCFFNLSVFIGLSTSVANGIETTRFKQLPGDENLASRYVNHIIQRHDGFIWIATAEGISRFDGRNFINHKSFPDNPNSLPNQWVNYLLEDNKNQLWVATSIGLARMRPDEITFEQYKFSPTNENSIAGNSIVHMFEDDQSRLWIASDRGLSLYQPESNDFKSFYMSSDIDNIDINNINTIAQKDTQQLWIGNDQGLFVFDVQTSQFTPFKFKDAGTKPFKVLDLDMDSKGFLWIATAFDGLKKLNKNHELISYRYQANNPNSIITDGLWSVTVDKYDNVWVASWGEGISKISGLDDNIKRYTHNLGDKRSIPSNLTTNVFEDGTGLIWIATYDGVALHDPANAIENISPVPGNKNSLSSELVWKFEETEDAIWIGTTEGINRWDKKTNMIENYYSSYNKDNDEDLTTVWTMTKANDQNIWLGTEYGLAQFNSKTKKINYLPKPPLDNEKTEKTINLLKNSVWSLVNNPDQSVWVGTNSANLYLVDKELNLIKDYSDLIQSTIAKYENIEFTNLTVDSNRNLWLSTASGMFFFDVSRSDITPVKSSQGEILFEKDWIYAVEKHLDNQYWISSQFNGLSLFQLNLDGSLDRLMHFDSSNSSIVERSVYNIFPINENEVWFTGRKNLYHIDLTSNLVTNYGRRYFDTDLDFHENSQFFSSNKRLYFGSNRGIIRFDPKQISLSNHQPRVYFTGIKSNSMSMANRINDPFTDLLSNKIKSVVDKTPVHMIESHTFNYSDTIFTFQFAALDFMNAEDLKYAYRIPELDEKWIFLQNKNELTLTNLNAGDYHLEVKATNADLQWSEHTAKITFTLLPKPWFTWWAKLIYLLIAAIVASIIFRLYRSRLLTQYTLKHREVQLSQAIWGSGDELWEWDINKKEITRTNSAQLDDNRQRFFDGSFETNNLNIHEDDVQVLQTQIQNILNGKCEEFDAVYRQKDREGNWVWMQDRAKVTAWSSDHKPLTVNGISRNINTIKKKEEKSQLIASAFQSSSDGALVLDAELKVISINKAFIKITGYDERIIDNTMQRDSGRISTDEMNSIALFSHIIEGIKIGGSFQNEIRITTIKGNTLPIDLRVNCMYNSQKVLTHYIATLTDITYRKNTEQVLKKMANYDSLTGLPNRSLMMIQLNKALLQAESDKKHMAIMFVDLDHFKNINDSLGHTIGDELLIAVANRLRLCLSKSDAIARIGGDEFTIGILSYDNVNDVIKVAEKILLKMSKPFQLENHELIITPSLGIATYNGDKIDIETLLMQADTAMYHAKKKGRNNFRFFTESMNQTVMHRVDIEMRLRKSLENEELFLNFQPKYCIATGKVSGFEALIRWKDANNTLTPPEEFIPIAEETGLIFPIGEFVLESACKELNRWHMNGFNDIHLAINLSAIQFMDKKLVEHVRNIMQEYNIPPLSLEIEITESTLIENLEYAIKTLHDLRKLGVKLSLDDFGTGYSSLNYLKQFPIHALKVDRSFIQDMVVDSRDASMVESIITLAHKLSIEVIAEGVETTEQLKMLSSYKAEEVQGFLLSKPVDSDTAFEILNQGDVISDLLNK